MNGSVFRAITMKGLPLALTVPMVLAAQAPDLGLSLDSLLNTQISAASKYEQTASEAPASVTIITSDQLDRLGYSRLGQVLEGVRGFYATGSRSNSFGTRGFSRPTDYNNRILVLIDGHSINEQVWGGSPIGDELPLNLSAIERIEIVRGPGSAVYGSSAVFGVINIVTRSAASLQGGVVGARADNADYRQATIAAGHDLGGGVGLSGSALLSDQSDGDAFYLRTASALATLQWHDVSLRTGYLGRSTGISIVTTDTAFNPPPTTRFDRFYWAELAVSRQYRGRLRVNGRMSYDWYGYEGTSGGPTDPSYADYSGSASVGAELLGVWDFNSRLRLTLGAEYRDVLRADYREESDDGTLSSDNAPYRAASAFGQAEYQLSSRLTAVAGVRTESHSRSGAATAPRGALIFAPNSSTSLKLLYGNAYRAPSAGEAHLETSVSQRNPSLDHERIQTMELSLSHRLAPQILTAMSVYQYHLRHVIEQVESTPDGALRFENTTSAEGTGVEFEVNARPLEEVQLRGSYTYQHATQAGDDVQSTDVPEHIASIEATMNRLFGLRPGVLVRRESGRINPDGETAGSFTRTDVFLGLDRRRGFDAGLRVTNLFDVERPIPGGITLPEGTYTPWSRRISVYGSWRF